MSAKGRVSFVGMVLLVLILSSVNMLAVFVSILFEAPAGNKLLWTICGIILCILFFFLFIIVAAKRLIRITPPMSYTEDTIHNVAWRWQWRKNKPAIRGCFCSKCEAELLPVIAESWQADLKCPRCGKTFVSLPDYTGNAKPRTFAQTQKEIRKIILARALAKNSPVTGALRFKSGRS